MPWEDVFESIEPEPLAAGTIGQVHRARLEAASASWSRCSGRTRQRRSSATSACSRCSRRRREGREALSGAGRHPGGRRASLLVAPPRARLPRGGVEHRADARGARPVLAARRAAACTRSSPPAAARDGRGRRAGRCASAARATQARGGAAAARGLLPPGADRGVLPRRPAPRQPAVGRRPIYLLDLGMVGTLEDERASCCSCCCSRSGARTPTSSPTCC